jgi:hypothetical protein
LHGRGYIHSDAAIRLVHRNAQQTQLTRAAKEFPIEALAPVRIGGLRLHFVLHKGAEGFGEQSVLRRGREQVGFCHFDSRSWELRRASPVIRVQNAAQENR